MKNILLKANNFKSIFNKKSIRNIISIMTFQVGVNVIGLPEFHWFELIEKVWENKKIAMFLIFASLNISCKTVLPIAETKTVETSKIIVANDSTKTIDKSLAIRDSLNIIIGDLNTGKRECDSLCKIEIERLLSQLNSYKQSGNNSSQIKYDKTTKSISVITNIGETTNKKTNTNTIKTIDNNKSTVKPIIVDKPFTKEQKFNLWTGRIFWLLLICGLSFTFYNRIKNLV